MSINLASIQFRRDVVKREKLDVKMPLSSEIELPDKVYTFEAPGQDLIFDDVYLKREYMYYIYLELVTPHNCSMTITLWDPDGKEYGIFKNDMYYVFEYARWFEVPFGTVVSGDYKLNFSVEADYNFNIYISLTEGVKVLHDKMNAPDVENLIFYEVSSFHDDQFIECNVRLETDVMYKFYLSRESPIALEENSDVLVNYYIVDPDDISFMIYDNFLIEGVDTVNFFSFGTSIGGVYKIQIRVYCDVDYVNVAYTISTDYEISLEVGGNESSPDSSDESAPLNNLWGNSTALPAQWVLGTLIIAVGVMILVVLIITRNKKKNLTEHQIG